MQLDSVVSPNPFHRPRAVLSLNIGGVESGESFTFVPEIYFGNLFCSLNFMSNTQSEVFVLNRFNKQWRNTGFAWR